MTDRQIDLLAKTGSFPEPASHTEVIHTHASWILLRDTHVYKIKKPLKFSFLDFSTLERRYFFCREELFLNRRFTEGIYLEVLPVMETPGGRYAVGFKETGTVVDYALRMKRLDNARQLNRLLAEGQVTPAEMRALAETVVRFHRTAERCRRIVSLQDLREKFNDLAGVRQTLEQHYGRGIVVDRAIAWSDAFLEAHFPRMLERENKGWVIDGHGDLHSGNIFLTDPPTLFDCIEFSRDFRLGDVLNDIAFLCMDLDYYQRPELGAVFMEAYLDRILCFTKPEDPQIFHYFKAYRANVRLKVESLQLTQFPQDALPELPLRKVKRYLELLETYLG